ncbi:ATP-dependent helicase C-terminal domain-containing protein [Arthrobacter sp. NPDC089319]|uniref:ATP-dependent helicase C-terminal domain-containing protein n=1 Tax=Arthrobacter sp. NPDC089319 TaxID=3155915 RepID=UPI003449AF32
MTNWYPARSSCPSSPLAVADELASFSLNTYPSVRAENRGGYAKRLWREDLLTAPPMRGTNQSGR